MSDVNTSRSEEDTIYEFSNKFHGTGKYPKWHVLRIALALSLHNPKPPESEWNENGKGGAEYKLETVTGSGKSDETLDKIDFTNAFRAMLSVYHGVNLFGDEKLFKTKLQGHIRRGLNEIRHCLDGGRHLPDFLLASLFDKHQELQREVPGERDLILENLSALGLNLTVQETLIGPRIVRYHLKLNHPEEYEALKQKVDMLSVQLGLKERHPFVGKTDIPLVIALDIPRNRETWRTVTASEVTRLGQASLAKLRLPVIPGVDVVGNAFAFDLVDAPHLLVAGTTGSGKSVCLRTMLYSLVKGKKPNQLNVCLIDPKKVEFNQFKELPHLYKGKVFTDHKSSLAVLRDIVDEMDFRNEELTKMGFRDLAGAEDAGNSPFPRLVVFVEELADLVMRTGDIQNVLVRLAQMSRSVGIHLILATQRPDAETFSGLLRSNIPSRIGLTVQKSTESQIILDEVGAEKLTGQGDMLIKLTGKSAIRVQGAVVTSEEVLTSARNN